MLSQVILRQYKRHVIFKMNLVCAICAIDLHYIVTFSNQALYTQHT